MQRTNAYRYLMLAFFAPIASAQSAEMVKGLLTTDGMTGQPKAVAHGWIEQNIYLEQLDTGLGYGARTDHTPPGKFAIPLTNAADSVPHGQYALFSQCYDGIPAFSCDYRLNIPKDKKELDNVQLNTIAHYSAMYNGKAYKAWGDSPWLQHDNFYQTFIAKTPHVTRLAVKLSDKSGDHHYMTLNFAIYETNDGPPSTWKKISPTRSRFLTTGTDPIIHILYVPYQSNEVKLTVGKRYAARFWRDESSQSKLFSLVVHTDKGDGYPDGHVYVGDEPRTDLDAYAYISGGMADTVTNHAPVGDLKTDKLVGGGNRFGQTFRATGRGLAAVDIIYTTGETRPPALPITFQLFDKPDGQPIGPKKVCYGIPLTFQGRAAAVWKPGEIKLTPGKDYYLEWSSPKGCNTWQLNEDLPGHAFVDGKPRPETDLALSIVEYMAKKK